MGPRSWSVLRLVGLNYIAFAFAKDFLAHPAIGSLEHTLIYLPFAALAVAGPILRAAAYVQGRSFSRRSLPAAPSCLVPAFGGTG